MLIFVLPVMSTQLVFGVVWGGGSGAGTTRTVTTVCMARWRFHYVAERVEGTALPRVGFHAGSAPAGGMLWTPTGVVVKRSRASLDFFYALIPLAIAFMAVLDKELIAQRNARRGCCTGCGYNLKGLDPIDLRTTCPECGKVKRHRRRRMVEQAYDQGVASGT